MIVPSDDFGDEDFFADLDRCRSDAEDSEAWIGDAIRVLRNNAAERPAYWAETDYRSTKNEEFTIVG